MRSRRRPLPLAALSFLVAGGAVAMMLASAAGYSDRLTWPAFALAGAVLFVVAAESRR